MSLVGSKVGLIFGERGIEYICIFNLYMILIDFMLGFLLLQQFLLIFTVFLYKEKKHNIT